MLRFFLKLFCELKLHAKFQNPRTAPSGRKINTGRRQREKERERRKNAVYKF
jgi:hypothetical protein